ncbi:MAG TPA: HPr(Ser) kinase/phosphatase [Clostridiales bacterium]|nr:HPr(Ser) kinase/phosphatase [Clostridiales bacterium]
MYTVALSDLIDKMGLENCTPDIDINLIKISLPDVNRPALQLAGFFNHFDCERVQVIGHVESAYMRQQKKEHNIDMMNKLMEYRVPCIVFSSNLEIDEEYIKMGSKKGIPILKTSKSTSSFMAEVIRWLKVELAPRITIHGVLVDVYGEGILITGESGIGKSEAALELIKRGHRLIADDVVEIKKVSQDTLIGTSPDITRHFIELRGIGIIDVKTLFGIESVKITGSIDLVIKLEEWSRDKQYDRLGLEENYIEYLGNKVICHSIPIRPGRNLAIICEAAAVNHRQKKMGYNAAKELYKRVTDNLKNKELEREEK